MARQTQETNLYPKTLLIGVDAPYNETNDINSYFEEFKNLAKTNNIENPEFVSIKIREIDPSTFITKGKLEQILEFCKKENIEQVVISEPLTSRQKRNLTDLLNCPVFDRTELILEIFEKAAITSEGKLQVEIAMLKHKKSRVAGRGIHLEQQRSTRGVISGAGETAKELALRHLEDQILKLNKKLEKLQQTRDTQRKKRLSQNIPQICIIGYTNAGKSTILNILTKSTVLAEDKLFATLDTTTREIYINNKKKGVISDTVGFIQQLPTNLIEAFKSTLFELKNADLLLHVVDISDKNWESQIKVVHEILEDLDVHSQMLYVFNKADKIPDLENIQYLIDKYNPHVIISALSKSGIEPLVEYLSTWDMPTTKPPTSA